MFTHIDADQVPEFELYNRTARLVMMYERTFKYSKLQHSAKCNGLYTTKPQNAKTIAEQAYIYEATLDGFAIQRWPNHSFANIKFPSTERK